MVSPNQPIEQWPKTLEDILQYYANLPYRYGDVKTHLIISQDRHHFLLVDEGWQQNQRVHGCLVHVEIREQKIWIHYDGIEDSITTELVAAGVPKDCIVLAFHPPELRQHTGYAIA